MRHPGLSRALVRLHFKQNSLNLHQRPCQCDRRDTHQKTWLSLAEGRTWSQWISLHLSPELCTWKKLFHNFIEQNGNHVEACIGNSWKQRHQAQGQKASNKGQLQLSLTKRQNFHRFWLFLKIILSTLNFPSNPKSVSFLNAYTFHIHAENCDTDWRQMQNKPV